MVDDTILVDDASTDETVKLAGQLGIKHILQHEKNKGYGANQKTCYAKALSLGADIIIMLHPDYQYNPKLIPSIAQLLAQDIYPVVLGSRILGKGAMQNGMPMYKYVFNRFLTFIQNLFLGQKNYPNIILVIVLIPVKCWNRSTWQRIPMILFLTMKCWHR